MFKKIICIALAGGMLVSSCKKKNEELPAPLTPDSKALLVDKDHGDLHVCVEKKLNESQHRTEGAIYLPSEWKAGQTIRIKFLNGDIALQARVKKAAAIWLSYANLTFQYVSLNEQADIKIAFRYQGDPGSWSYFGTDCRYIPQNEPSMNFGWFTASSSDLEIQRTTLHEFGHALGLLHEQSSPAANINWNKEVVYNYYTGAPNYWTREDVDHNVFYKFSTSYTNYSAYDKYSIMQYAIPAAFTTDGFSVGNNTALSQTDKYFIGQRYPFASTVKSMLLPGEQLNHNQYITSPDGRFKLILQADGNVVLYKDNAVALWQTRTQGRPFITNLLMKQNGNLVLLDRKEIVYWHSYTYNNPGAFLQVDNTGNASIFRNGIKLWSTNTGI